MPKLMNPLKNKWQRDYLCLDVTHPGVQTLADEAQAFCKRFYEQSGPSLLVLAGDSGSGKTHVARKIHDWIRQASFSMYANGKWRTPPTAFFCSWPLVVNGFKEGQYGVLQDLFEEPFCVIDDIGAEHDPSKNATDKLCQVLSRRERLWTIITTNIPQSDWAARFDARIFDRLLRNSKTVNLFDVDSYAVVKLERAA